MTLFECKYLIPFNKSFIHLNISCFEKFDLRCIFSSISLAKLPPLNLCFKKDILLIFLKFLLHNIQLKYKTKSLPEKHHYNRQYMDFEVSLID